MILLRVSELSSLGDCRRQWWWYRHWSPPTESTGLLEGELVHRGLEVYYRSNRSLEAVRREPTNNPLVDAIVQHYADYDNTVEQLEGSIEFVEKRFTVPLRNPDTGEERGDLLLSGKCDLGLRNGRGLRLVDHKAFSPRTLARLGNLENVVLVDWQLTGYAYLVWRATGELPREVILNILVKVVPQKPYLLRDGTPSRSRSQPTTGVLYRQTLDELGLDHQPYRDILDFYDRDYSSFFRRVISTRSRAELEAYERHLWRIGQEVASLVSDPSLVYPSPSLYRCGSCPFLQACKEADSGGDPEAILSLWPVAQIDLELGENGY
jgi:hypothetical protein